MLNFSLATKNELAHLPKKKKCCARAELAALLRMDGEIHISGGDMFLQVVTDNAAVARRIFSLLKDVFRFSSGIMVVRRRRLRKNNVYLIRVDGRERVKEIMETLGFIDSAGQIIDGVDPDLLSRDCCRRAYLRGAFLGGGSVSSPEGTYHLEITAGSEEHAAQLVEVMKGYGLTPGINRRRNQVVVYLKGSDGISTLLSLMGAHTALLNFENVRIYKDMRNHINRLVNCETANLNKTVDAAMRQVENIRFLDRHLGIDNLPPGLKEVARLRLAYPDASLKELGNLLTPPLSKSGVNHRLRRLDLLAEKMRAEGEGKKNG